MKSIEYKIGQAKFVKLSRKPFFNYKIETLKLQWMKKKCNQVHMVAWKQESYSENLYNRMIYSNIPLKTKFYKPSSSTTMDFEQWLPHLCQNPLEMRRWIEPIQ